MASIDMPQLGFDMQEGTLVRWLKQPGDEVKRGESVAEIETDKAVIEIEAFESGTITQLLVEEGATVPVGEPIAVLDTGDGGALPEPKAVEKTIAPPPAAVEPMEAPAAAAPAPAPTTTPVAAPAPAEGLRVKASPLARRLAAEHRVDLHRLTGSGPGGRIVKQDVLQAAETPAGAPPAATVAAPADEVVPLTRLRQTIARRLVESKQQVPHFYVTVAIDMDKAMQLRSELKELGDDVGPVSVNDLVMKAAALALQKHPGVNSSFEGDAIRRHGAVHLGMAVAIEGGLITPVIRDCHAKSLFQIAAEARELAAAARDRSLHPDQYQGNTFTISNLGMFGVEEFSAIINPPAAAILAVSGIIEKPVVRNGELAVGKVMKVTLSADHRATDGAEVALFLQDVKRILENPLLLLV